MTFELGFKSDIKRASRRLTNIRKRQIPYATSKALNQTAFEARKHLVEVTFPRDSELRNRRLPSALLRVKKAIKRMRRAAVFDALGREYLQTQATGGVKKARGGRIAVPGPSIRRGAPGVVKSQRPRTLLTKKGVFATKKAILRRKRGAVELLFRLTAKARIPKRLRFYEDANKIGRQRFGSNYVKALRQAIKTARPR